MIKIYKTFFDGAVKLIKLHKFIDNRGYFVETFLDPFKLYAEKKIKYSKNIISYK